MFSFPVMKAGEWAIVNAPQLNVDTLLLHGTGDPIIDFQGTQEFYDRSKNTHLELFEGAYHELHHDLCRDEVLSLIASWLDRKAQGQIAGP